MSEYLSSYHWLLVSLVVGIPLNGYAAEPKSLVIGIDGLGYGERGMTTADTPNIDRLFDGSWAEGYQSAFSHHAIAGGITGTETEQRSSSGPGWSTILTGVWADQHHVRDNSFAAPNLDEYPTYFELLEEQVPNFSSTSVVHWTPIDTHLISTVDDANSQMDFRTSDDSDSGVMFSASTQLRNLSADQPAALFVHFDEVDGAGHSCGSSGACYQKEIQEVDLLVGRLLAAIQRRDTFADEDWQVILTSDHGHTPQGGHGGQSSLEKRIPFVVSSRHVEAGPIAAASTSIVSHADVAPTVLEHFGVELSSRFAGTSRARSHPVDSRPLSTLFKEDFEGLSLQRSPEEDVDSSRPVWTKTPPADWTIEDRVPGHDEPSGNNGVEDWIGWNFVDARWWSDVADDQGRSEFTLGTGTVAVADPDEWDDQPHPDSAASGWYNTWMTTPEIDVSGTERQSIVVEFDSSWRPEFDADYHQTANLAVSFDGGERVELFRWESDSESANYKAEATNERVRLELDAPLEAGSMSLTFGMFDAGNDWWWAIDNLAVLGLVTGDMNGDGAVDVSDIDRITEAVRGQEDGYDLNQDGVLDELDRMHLLEHVLGTAFGDATLDGFFDSGDLVTVFLSGTYESDKFAGWAQGDWNGDARFDSADLVLALRTGSYRADATALAVPEPSSMQTFAWIALIVGMISCRSSQGAITSIECKFDKSRRQRTLGR